jgi:predicted NAD/FAD-dependent oxidoreductase
VIIIWAGISGLAAANRLDELGYNVTILESRNRLGGRIWAKDQWPRSPVDLGDSWIHGVTGNAITAIARGTRSVLNANIIRSFEQSLLIHGVPLTMRHSFRMPWSGAIRSQGFTLGWYAWLRWSRKLHQLIPHAAITFQQPHSSDLEHERP